MSRIQPGLPFVRADGGSGGGGGGVGIDLTPILRWLLTPAGLITLAVLLILLLALVTAAGLRIRRAIRRRLPAGRQLVQRATLDWRAQTLPPGGPYRRLVELQSRLAQERAASDDRAGGPATAPLAAGALPGLAGRLDDTGQALAGQLHQLQREPDPARLTAVLPVAEQQVTQWCAAAASVRAATRSAALEASAGQVDELTSQVELEVASVQAGVDYLTERRTFTGAPANPDPTDVTDQPPPRPRTPSLQPDPRTPTQEALMTELLCPKCQASMTSQDRNGVTIERCAECGGIFLDRGELERLETAEAPGLTGPAAAPSQGSTSQAPASGQALFGELLTLARQYKGSGGRGRY